MPKHKNKNQAGSFNIASSEYKKYVRYFVATLLVAIFVIAASLYAYKKFHHEEKAAKVSVADSPLPDWWLQKYFRAGVCNQEGCKPEADPDMDGLTNQQEFYYHSNPLKFRTVDDELSDGQMVAQGFDPSRSGRMTFDQVATPENILGESLLVQQDFQDLVNEAKDISKVPLSLVSETDLKITKNSDDETYENYVAQLRNTLSKYFSDSDISDIAAILKTASDSNLEDFNRKAGSLSKELKTIEVPEKMLAYHQYVIAFFDLIPKVLLNSSDPALYSESQQSDEWYENAQALFAVAQKLQFEEKKLNIENTQ